MDATNLPTDSIYKFFGLAGLLLLILSLTYPVNEMRNIEEELLKFEKDTSVLRIEKYFFDKKIRIQFKFDSMSTVSRQVIKRILLNKGTIDTTKILIDNNSKDFESFSNNYQECLKNLDEEKLIAIKAIEIEYNVNRTAYLINESFKWLLICFIGMIIGSVLLIYGLFLWYTKSQVYLDFILKKDAFEKGYVYEDDSSYMKIIRAIVVLLYIAILVVIFTSKNSIWVKIILSVIAVAIPIYFLYKDRKLSKSKT